MPDHIDPWRAAKNGLSFGGELPLERFPRLLEVGIVDEGEPLARVEYQLDFRRNAQRQLILEGWARVRLRVLCQRCLSDLWLNLDAPMTLRLVRVEPTSADALQSDYEPLVVTDDVIDPFELIEDELLLMIPSFPRHPVGECQSPVPMSGETDAPSTEQVKARRLAESVEDTDQASHPFAILERLKKH
ncbi:YceD family protein [Allochromatium palmeri]|uniref:YceD family protein n=1 Tax=Allochromatium palmeri TaxID=231048 RepID=UPI0016426742|nr:YceD family protein [Allochromatium palmeri]